MKKSNTKLSATSGRGIGLYVAFVLLLAACTPEGVINKTKYNGEKVTNTCETFTEEVNALIAGNAKTGELIVAQYDNSDFGYFFLEPGQWEIKDGNLNFRLGSDLEYEKYLVKGVAIHVTASYKSAEHLAGLENPNAGDIGTLIVDHDYWNAHKDPFMLYQIPAPEGVNGKQIILKFSVVKYKKGKIKKEFCNSVEVPLGPAEPQCCTWQPWENAGGQSLVEMPDVKIEDETYRYRGFTGTLDLIFPENSTQFDKKLLSSAIQDYIKKYETKGFSVTSINIEGFASLGGKLDYNQKLSDKRATAVAEDLKVALNGPTVNISAQGKGEDWSRFILLTKTSALNPQEQSATLAIANAGGTADEKEAELRKLGFWKKLVDEVIVNTRHTFVTFNFDYVKDKMWVENYPSQMPVISDELFNVASKTMTVSRYRSGDVKPGLKVLDILIGNNKKANLFAMRSTYNFGKSDFRAALSDIDQAIALDKNNLQYALAGLAYKTRFADSYGLEERMTMLESYNDYVNRFPDNRSLFLNRAVMMDKVGYLSGALKEYADLLEGADPTATNYNNRGVTKMKTYRLTEAEADFNAAIEKDPSIAEAYYNLGIIYSVRGLTGKAVQNLEKAVQFNPEMKKLIWTHSAFRIQRDTPAFDKFR